MLPFFRDRVIPHVRISDLDEADEDGESVPTGARLSRAVSMRVLGHLARRPWGSPRSLGPMRHCADDFASPSALLRRGFWSAASAGSLLYLARGRARSLPALSVLRRPPLTASYALLMAAFKGKNGCYDEGFLVTADCCFFLLEAFYICS